MDIFINNLEYIFRTLLGTDTAQKSNLFVDARISKWRSLNFCTKKCDIVSSSEKKWKNTRKTGLVLNFVCLLSRRRDYAFLPVYNGTLKKYINVNSFYHTSAGVFKEFEYRVAHIRPIFFFFFF